MRYCLFLFNLPSPPPVPLFRKYTVHVYVVADGSHPPLLNN